MKPNAIGGKRMFDPIELRKKMDAEEAEAKRQADALSAEAHRERSCANCRHFRSVDPEKHHLQWMLGVCECEYLRTIPKNPVKTAKKCIRFELRKDTDPE